MGLLFGARDLFCPVSAASDLAVDRHNLPARREHLPLHVKLFLVGLYLKARQRIAQWGVYFSETATLTSCSPNCRFG